MKGWTPWIPAGVMSIGVLLTIGVVDQRQVPLKAPLEAGVPDRINGYEGRDLTLSSEEVTAAGVTAYLLRLYDPPNGKGAAQVYVGYYDRQLRGKSIHSPKNCLPGGGWEALAVREHVITVGNQTITVNQYLIQRKQQRALVLYWYQGRGRVEANEYAVKFNLLRDAALRRRSDEALVRIVVPVTNTEKAAADVASRMASVLVKSLDTALPS